MKKIIFLLCITSAFLTNAQTFNSKTTIATTSATRGNGSPQAGVYLPVGYTIATICTLATATVTPISATSTTLTNGRIDTAYAQWALSGNNNTNKTFDFLVTKNSGTVAGTLLLQGSYDNATWFTVTGVATYCAGCSGASATVGNATTHYLFFLPSNSNNFNFWQGRVITSDTSGNATFSAKAYTSY